MCTYNDVKEVKRLINRRADSFLCYKIYNIGFEGRIRSPFYHSYGPVKFNKNGVIKSNSRTKKVCRVSSYAINKGIHVYLSRETANVRFNDNYSPKNSVVVKLLCHKKDLIGTDGERAVFRKVQLPKTELKRLASIEKKFSTK